MYAKRNPSIGKTIATAALLSVAVATASAQDYGSGLGLGFLFDGEDPLLEHVDNYRPYNPERGLRDDRGVASVFFPVNESRLDIDFAENANVLIRAIRLMKYLSSDKSPVGIYRIRIVGLASIEGPEQHNRQLAGDRAIAMRSFLQRRLPQLPDSLYEVVNGGEAWGELTSQLEEIIREPLGKPVTADEARRVLKYIYLEPDLDQREQLIRNIDGGELFYRMHAMLLSQRNSGFIRIYYGRPGKKVTFAPQTVTPTDGWQQKEEDPFRLSDDFFELPDEPGQPDTLVTVQPEEPVITEPAPREYRPFRPWFAVRTNMALDAALVPNLGVEVALGRGFTVAADWNYAWWYSDRKHRYWQTYGGYLTARKYFGAKSQEDLPDGGFAYAGHHVGLYADMLTYDLELGGRGYQSPDWGFGFGLEYGYALPIWARSLHRRLLLDFTIGLGYQGGKYYVYDPIDGQYVLNATRQRHWIGPTKAEISLKYILGNTLFDIFRRDK